mmetsp:Transcript_25839/g.65566  ORF Transcript_25839/g.65566 Transcript_25839/m.65566 type:complete len:213 (-) Transcript_25839:305-943(-)
MVSPVMQATSASDPLTDVFPTHAGFIIRVTIPPNIPQDLGLTEEEAYAYVLEQRAAADGPPDEVTALTLKWAQMTDVAIVQTMSDVETTRAYLPRHWNTAAANFTGTPQPGANIIVKLRPAAASSADKADEDDSEHAPRAGMDELDAEMREVVEFVDDVVSRKLDEIEATLRELLSEPAGSEQAPDAEYFEQDVPAPSGIPSDVYELKVKRM